MSVPYIGTLMIPLLASLLILPCTLATVWVKPYPICAGPARWPQIQCDGNGTNTIAQGYEAEVFIKAVALGLNWTQGIDYYFACKDVTVMLGLNLNGQGALIDNVTSPGLCYAGISAIVISDARLKNGVRFSFPHYSGPLRLLTMLSLDVDKDIWAFFYPFASNLWMVIGLTGLLIPILTIIIDIVYWHGSELSARFNLLGFWTNFSRLLYISICNLMQPGPKDLGWAYEATTQIERRYEILQEGQERVQAMPSYLLLLTFGFLTLIVCSSYTATLASYLAASSTLAGYQTVGDLKNQPTGTTGTYATGAFSLASKYGVQAVTILPFSIENILNDWIPRLRSGQVKAVVVDETVINEIYYNATRYSSCDLYRPLEAIELVAWGFGFHIDVPQGIVDRVSTGIRQLTDNGELSTLKETWFTNPGDPCPNRDPKKTDGTAPRIGLDNMWGLWIILAATFGVALLTSLVTCCVRRFRFGGYAVGCFVQDIDLIEGTQVKVMDESELMKRKDAWKDKKDKHLSFNRDVSRKVASEVIVKPKDTEPTSIASFERDALMELIESLTLRMDKVVEKVDSLSHDGKSGGVKQRSEGMVQMGTVNHAPVIQKASREEEEEVEEEMRQQQPESPPSSRKKDKSTRALPPLMTTLEDSPKTPSVGGQVKAPAELDSLKSPQEHMDARQEEPGVMPSASKVPLLAEAGGNTSSSDDPQATGLSTVVRDIEKEIE